MVIFHGYVSLPEGILTFGCCSGFCRASSCLVYRSSHIRANVDHTKMMSISAGAIVDSEPRHSIHKGPTPYRYIYICIYIYTSIYISDYGFIPHRTRYSSEFPIRIRFPFWCPFFCSWPRLPLELSARSCHRCDVPGPADFWDFIKDFMVILWYPLAI